MSSSNSVRRAVALLLIAVVWIVAILGSLASLFAAYLGRADWGDGRPPESLASTAILVAVAVLALLAAGWVTRMVATHDGRDPDGP